MLSFIYAFLYSNKRYSFLERIEKLRHSLGRPSCSDFVQFQFVEQNSVECWCDFGTTLYQTILTIFTISNGVLKTPRDNLCGISCGTNNSCRTPRIALQFFKVQMYFYTQKALLLQSFCVSLRAIRESPLRISTFTSSKNTRPRASDLSSTICFNQKGRFNL